MPRAFSLIAYTPSVQSAQTRYGSRDSNAAFEHDPDPRNVLTDMEAEFIPKIDTFFMASTGENGWPYVQHRGGPRGFLKILDERTLGFADFSGNRQYISAGNVMHDGRVMLILMNLAYRQRLKVWGRARIVHETDDPELIARLEVPSYRARVERGFIITVEALDFNCPQHITARYSADEIADPAFGLRPAAPVVRDASESAPVMGAGELELAIVGMRQLTPTIRAYELRRPDGADLPPVAPGACLAMPVPRSDKGETRLYSITSDTRRRDRYEIAVLRTETGRGSALIHEHYRVGSVVRCGLPRNAFALHDDARPVVLIAGGIGITPIKAMAQALRSRGREFALHYVARSEAQMAYRDEIGELCGSRARLYFSVEGRHALDVEGIFAEAPDNAVFYVCGPAGLVDAAIAAAGRLGIDTARLRYERFIPATGASDAPISLYLAKSAKSLDVDPGVSVLDAVLSAGVAVPFDCRAGVCGACAVKVMEGEPDHRDSVLTAAERERAGLMCVCVSRANSARLVLDL